VRIVREILALMATAIVLTLLWTPAAYGRLEILLADPSETGSSFDCRFFFLIKFDLFSFYSHLSDDEAQTIAVTRQQVRDIYREIHIAPEAELAAMDEEEKQYPAQAVIYIRSVNDQTGKTEGIMRLVSARKSSEKFAYIKSLLRYWKLLSRPKPPPYYFNNFLSYRFSGFKQAQLPMDIKSNSKSFHKFLQKHYPNSFEMGRVVFAQGVNEFRVLVDMGVMVASLGHLDDNGPQAHFVAEAVPQARRRYEFLGLEAREAPVELKEGRVFMAGAVDDLYDKYLGRVRAAVKLFSSAHPQDTATQLAARNELDQTTSSFSDSPALSNLYTYGIYERALLAYSMDDFPAMLKDARLLAKRGLSNPEFRMLLAAAEVGIRYDFLNHRGDSAAALTYLRSAEGRDLLSPEKLPLDSVAPGLLEFYEGMICISSGDYAGARESKRKIDALYTAGPGTRASVENYGIMNVSTMRRKLFDPATQNPAQVDRGMVLHAIENSWAQEHPASLSHAFYSYCAEVYRAFDLPEKAALAERKAEALRD
jgi:hypothetical protein